MSAPGLLCLAGPTGSGKTAAALNLARRLERAGQRAVVINADSRQVYADFPLITAQPSAAEHAVCPHRLYGYLPATVTSSAGRWAERARAALAEADAQGLVPVLVGGTGLYLRALLDGMADIPAAPQAIRARLLENCRTDGSAALHARLAAIDPEYASRIHPHDRQRVLRALEVWESTGHTFSWWHSHTPPPLNRPVLRLGVGLPLDELTPLLHARILAMLKAGALDEARAALAQCPDTTAPGWSGIGCAELAAHLAGTLSLEECVELWTRNTRAYAKRQWTWFRADTRMVWHRPGDDEALAQRALKFLRL
ncbi:MAG: tRNA (adenosine(37)-N6)-dimethylallyltransferase MiaA [Desulfovibrionaceae bacterium]|nr:tRNA (adenosine(37)-N6)-dimethylallyltransferase MiaA [Desulfovibrionaceae bacterium]